MARRPETLEEGHRVEIPVTNVFRQAEHLDRALHDLRARRAEEREFAEEEYCLLRFRISGQTVELEVERRSLREALNLPDMDLNGMEDFRDDNDSDDSVSGSDVEDIDHMDLE